MNAFRRLFADTANPETAPDAAEEVPVEDVVPDARRFLEHPRAVRADEPSEMGLFTRLPKGVDPATEDYTPPQNPYETPHKLRDNVYVPDVEVEDGVVLGVIWPYTNSMLRGERRDGYRHRDRFNHDGFNPHYEAPVAQSEDMAREPTGILWREAPQAEETHQNEANEAEADVPWYLRIDPELYEQTLTVFTSEFRAFKKQQGKEKGAKRSRIK